MSFAGFFMSPQQHSPRCAVRAAARDDAAPRRLSPPPEAFTIVRRAIFAAATPTTRPPSTYERAPFGFRHASRAMPSDLMLRYVDAADASAQVSPAFSFSFLPRQDHYRCAPRAASAVIRR